MRGDFTSVAAGKTTVSHLVVANDISYVWIEQPLQGFRMSFATMSGQNGGQGSVDANANVEYKCQGWSADEAKFDLPKDLQFQDVDAMKKAAMDAAAGAGVKAGVSAGAGATGAPTAEQYAAQVCATCDMVTDATAKAQCKAHYDCR